jgi:hypothetical protein
MAKAEAKVARATSGESGLPPAVVSEPARDDLGADETSVESVEQIAPDARPAEADEPAEAPAPPEPTDPRARAAQRVQRRLGKDAEKLSAAEARARAREEARRRRAQAKEQGSGVVAEEAVRPPEGPAEGNLTEDVSVVEIAGQAIEDEPVIDDPVVEAESAIDEPVIDEPVIDEVVDEPEVLGEAEPDVPEPIADQRIEAPGPAEVEDEPGLSMALSEPGADVSPSDEEPKSGLSLAGGSSSSRGTIAGVVGLIALGISVLLAVGALLVAIGFDSGGLYEALRAVANFLVGPLEGAFDFSGANAERKEHFLAWGAGSILYLLISFVGQAVQRANDDK